MNSNKLKLVGIIIAVIGIIIALIIPDIYHNVMENKCQDDITTVEATVMAVTCTSEYHRGGKGSRGSTSYIYNIIATYNGEAIELLKHDSKKENLQIERNDTITVYCLNDRYAYAPEDFYVMSDLAKALMISPLFIGTSLALISSFIGKNNE